jgi:hypothetical protein
LKRLLTLTLGLSLALGACTPAGPDTSDATALPLAAEQSKDFTDGYTSSTEQAVSSISLDDVITASSVPNSDRGNPDQSDTGLINLNMPIRIKALPSGCRTIDAGSNDDRDETGIPKEVTYRYNPEKCRLIIPGGTRTIAGTLRIDSDEKDNKGGYQERLEVTLTDRIGNQIISERRSGTAILIPRNRRGIKQFDKVFKLEIKRRVNGRTEFSYRNNIVYTYVPDSVEGVEVNRALPAGTVSVAGSTEWFQAERKTRSFVVNSPTTLTYDPACAKQQGQGITGGKEILKQDGKIVQITYGACGTAPVVQFDPK